MARTAMKVAPMVIRARPKRPVNNRPVLASTLKPAMNALTPCASCAGLAWMKLRAASSPRPSRTMPSSR